MSQSQDPVWISTSPRLASVRVGTVVVWLAVLVPTLGRGQLQEPPSPLDVHQRLRAGVHAGRDVSGILEDWIQRTGDHSFDGLRHPSELNRRALRRQLEALSLWDGGRLEEAEEAYRDAASLAMKAGNATEVVFCRYYIAEILARRDRFEESLSRLDEALAQASGDPSPKPYLEALLLQSRGYALWLMDRLQAGIHAFGEAQRRWTRLSFPHGTAANWNNLAGLHEDLGFAARAEDCYRMALETAEEEVFPEIRLQIHANFALFLLDQGRRREALRQYDRASEWRSVNPLEFLLLRCRLFDDPESRRRLERMEGLSEGENIERLLVLAETEAEDDKALALFGEALRLSRKSSQRRWLRISARKTAARQERRGNLADAALLYREALRRRESDLRPEFIFPYSRVVSAAFDGWIRCLVGMGRSDLAWSEIQRRLQRSAFRARRFMETPPVARAPRDSLEKFLEAVRLDAEFPSDQAFQPSPAGPPPTPATEGRHGVLEMWPDGRRIFAWIANRGGFHFRVLQTTRPVSTMVAEAVDPFYRARESLPPQPDRRLLRRLYDELILPLRDLLDSKRLLFVGRKELEPLPIEMLMEKNGAYLLESLDVSYLPQAYDFPAAALPDEAPLALLPSFAAPPAVMEERRFFQRTFPEARRPAGLEALDGARARWIHVSSHLDLDRDFWIGSPVGFGSPRPLSSLLQTRFTCRLLSLGVCDAANSRGWGAPYWLSLAQLMLARDVEALLISRWKLDEFSTDIYRDFFRLCKDGLPMDEALAQARRKFLGRTLRRRGAEAAGAHPFFWAGVSYVGRPGLRLYPEKAGPPLAAVVIALLAGVASLLHRLALETRTKG